MPTPSAPRPAPAERFPLSQIPRVKVPPVKRLPETRPVKQSPVEDDVEPASPQVEHRDAEKPQQQLATSIDNAYNCFLNRRYTPKLTSSYLRPGSVFAGTQQSGQVTYEVTVELKNVDMEKAYICGYLRIEGLTEDNKTLITYFEGEMVSPMHSFYTKREEWGASEKTDVAHWSRFAAWRRLSHMAQDPSYVHKDYEQKSHIFMRWKECFLVPDYRVQDIQGASYAGFYYICFDQANGSFTGYYYHQKSDRYQQLDLAYSPSRGQYGSYEFR